MSTLATYSFLPWLRQGLANRIGAPASGVRATVRVDLQIAASGGGSGNVTQTVGRDVALFGPGDVVGIDPRAIVRVEPRPFSTNFEPNYLAHIEFYDEGFPWRYTPAAPSAGRLTPWMALVVLEEGEFTEGAALSGRPLPFVQLASLSVLPPAAGMWAWGHVHVNRGVTAPTEVVSGDMNAVLPRVQATLSENADLAYSRLVCPRRLEPNTGYHAFLVPAFESGRLAGLGLDPAGAPGPTASAWGAYPARAGNEPNSFPVYHRWEFRTGAAGDFESLVRLLEAKPVDSRVGTRPIDVRRPGANLPGITDPALGGILRLGGALRVPTERLTAAEAAVAQMYEGWATPYPHPFQEALARFINLADDYTRPGGGVAAAHAAASGSGSNTLAPSVAGDPDPMVTAPLYGRWHALTRRLLFAGGSGWVPYHGNWVHELNLDPRHRVAAGFGTRVVQERQERYMDAAWEQVGEVLEANRRIRLAQLAREAGRALYAGHLLPLHAAQPERALGMAAPVGSKVMAGGATVRHQLAASRVQPALVSAPARRMLAPRGRLARGTTFEGAARPGNLLARVNDGSVSAALPRETPAATTINQVARLVAENGKVALEPHLEEGRFAKSIDLLPMSPAFVLTEPGDREQRFWEGDRDSEEASRFKEALRDSYALVGASAEVGAETVRESVDLKRVGHGLLAGVDPDVTVPRRLWAGVRLPQRIRAALPPEEFVEAMAYPVIDEPMYKPLVDISTELFLPNLGLIEPNSITLLETNQKFIEAYMVGLNHEFARELLWREFPTDQRGSYFRQFWDVKDYLPGAGETPEAARERLRDIPKLHRWSRASALGAHDQREIAGEKEEEVVLAIRGELLKRYPTAVLYAHRAQWQLKGDGSIDPTKERILAPLTAAEEADPPRSKLRTPLYEAKVEPDIYFFGFDLTAAAAKGGTGANPTDDPGWFFVIKERPGEPRFGLDTGAPQPNLTVWNDLSWADVLPGAGDYIPIPTTTAAFSLVAPDASEPEKADQYAEDRLVPYGSAMSAADFAYVLFQAPALVAVHAAEMLRPR
jgi:hypothetical protein